MHPDLSFFPNKTFYFSKLSDSTHVIERNDPLTLNMLKGMRNVLINLHNSKEGVSEKSHSYFNREEADLTCDIVSKIIINNLELFLTGDNDVNNSIPEIADIGIITPYSA